MATLTGWHARTVKLFEDFWGWPVDLIGKIPSRDLRIALGGPAMILVLALFAVSAIPFIVLLKIEPAGKAREPGGLKMPDFRGDAAVTENGVGWAKLMQAETRKVGRLTQ